MKIIILDTSFLLAAFTYKIDILTNLTAILDTFQLAIVDKTLDELKGKPMASLITAYLAKHNAIIIPTPKDKNVDNLILNNLTKDTIVATQDKKLKEKLKKRKTGILTIRQKRYIMLI